MRILLLFLSFLIFLLFLPILIFCLLFLWLYKLLVTTIVYCVCYYQSVSYFSALDSALVFTSNNFYATTASTIQNKQQQKCLLTNIGGILFLEDNPTLQEIKELFTRKVLNFSQFLYRLNRIIIKFMGYHYWIKPRILNLEQVFINKSIQDGPLQLESFSAEWIQQPFPSGHPLWQICICRYNNNNNNNKSTALLFKMSHCIGDGYACGQIIGKLLGTEYQIYPQKKMQAPNIWKLIFHIIKSPKILLDNLQLIKITDYFAKAEKTDSCVIAFKTVPLKIVKDLRQKYKCKFYEILLAALGNALSDWLPLNGHEIPNYVSIVLPVALPRNQAHTLGNMMSFTSTKVLSVPVDLHPPNIDRIQQFIVQSNTESAKHSQLLISSIIALFQNIPVPSFGTTAVFVNRAVTMSFSSFPSPTNTNNLNLRVNSSAILLGLQVPQNALMCTAQTWNNQITITLTGNKGVFKTQASIQQLGNYMEQSLMNMHMPFQVPTI